MGCHLNYFFDFQNINEPIISPHKVCFSSLPYTSVDVNMYVNKSQIIEIRWLTQTTKINSSHKEIFGFYVTKIFQPNYDPNIVIQNLCLSKVSFNAGSTGTLMSSKATKICDKKFVRDGSRMNACSSNNCREKYKRFYNIWSLNLAKYNYTT